MENRRYPEDGEGQALRPWYSKWFWRSLVLFFVSIGVGVGTGFFRGQDIADTAAGFAILGALVGGVSGLAMASIWAMNATLPWYWKWCIQSLIWVLVGLWVWSIASSVLGP